MYIGKGGGLFIPHCNALPSLVYKTREESLIKGLPILSKKGIPLRSRVLLCSLLLLLLLLEKFLGVAAMAAKLC